MVYEMVTGRLKMRLFVIGFLIGVTPLILFGAYHLLTSGFFTLFFISKGRVIQGPRAASEAPIRLAGETPTRLAAEEAATESRAPASVTPVDSRWLLVQENYKKLVSKNDQLNAVILYHPACALGTTHAVVSGKFTTEQMIKIYSDLYASYQLRWNQMHSTRDCHQAMALFDAGAQIQTDTPTKTAVAFEQVKDGESSLVSATP